MKKAIVTIGLFSFALVLTSFTSNEQSTSSQKNDSKAEILKIENVKLEVTGEPVLQAGSKKND
jgi:hypothetical protein